MCSRFTALHTPDGLSLIVQTAMRLGRYLVYETFSAAQCLQVDNHISDPAFTLSFRELSPLFPTFDVVAYREDALHDRTVQRFLGRPRSSE